MLVSVQGGGGSGVDRETEELFSGLATRFDSALARQEDRAAGDLARSLACGRDTRSLVAAGARVIVPTGTAELVATLGTDYCTCGEGDRWVVPLAMAELVVQSDRKSVV